MGCSHPKYKQYLTEFVTVAAGPGSCSNIASPWLIASNEPEELALTPFDGPVTLYRGYCQLPGGGGSVTQRFRLFFWHLNSGEFDLTFRFMLRVGESGCSLSNHNLAERVVPFPDYAAAAVCLAWEQLFDALPSVTNNVLLKKNLEVAVQSWTAEPHEGHRLVAAVYEFDLTGPAGTTVWFRTLCTATGSNGAWDQDPPAPHPTHPHVRGWWPKSALEVPMAFGSFNSAPTGGDTEQQSAVCEQLSAIEHSTEYPPLPGGFGAMPGAGHEFDLANKGCYGANLEYTAELTNSSTTQTGYVHVGLVARNVNVYFGAAHASSPDPVAADKRYVPPLAYIPPDPPEEPDAQRELVDLLQSRTGMRIPVSHGPPTILRVRVANGGACATPVNFVLSREPLEREEVEEPQ